MKDSGLLTSVGDNVEEFSDDSVKMSISEEGSRYLIANLTNLYTHPELAILREYTANALDSHIRANQKQPIEVTIHDYSHDETFKFRTIKKLSFDLIIEDFGTGMSRDEIINIYSQYGASTKRDTNTQVGAYGLGGKSALSLTDRFNVVSIKDGIEIVFNVIKGEDGVGVIDFVSENPTNKGNGFKVSINVPETNLVLSQAAENFFAMWKPNSILVNGVEPYLVAKDPSFLKVAVSDDEILGYIHIAHDQYNSSTIDLGGRISLGGITYPMSRDDIQTFKDVNGNIEHIFRNSYIEALIGSIDLTAPREGIRYSKKTQSALRKTFKDFIIFARETIQDHINSLSRLDALNFQFANAVIISALFNKEYVNLYALGQGQGGGERVALEWHGEPIETRISFTSALSKLNSQGQTIFYEAVTPSTKIKREIIYSVGALNILERFDSAHHVSHHYRRVVNLKAKSMVEDSQFTRNIRDYAKSILDGDTNLRFIVTNDDFNEDSWINALAPEITWDEIIEGAKQYRSELKQKPRAVKPVAYPVWNVASGTLTLRLTSDMVTEKVLYIKNEDDLIYHDKLWSEVGAITRGYRTFASGFEAPNYQLTEFFLMFDALFSDIENIVLLDKKSSNVLIKNLPEAVSMVEELHKKLLEKDVVEQNHINVYAHLANLSKGKYKVTFPNLLTLKSNCTALVESGWIDQVQDEQIRGLVKYIDSSKEAKQDAINRYLALSLLKNESNVDEYMDVLKQAPLLLSRIQNLKHLVAYLNVIDFSEKDENSIMI